MAFIPNTNRNYKGITHQELREKIDGAFNAAHDELSKAYYDHWKHGDYSVQFRGHAPAQDATAEDAKHLFDKLHGLIFVKQQLRLDDENEKLKKAEKHEDISTRMHGARERNADSVPQVLLEMKGLVGRNVDTVSATKRELMEAELEQSKRDGFDFTI